VVKVVAYPPSCRQKILGMLCGLHLTLLLFSNVGCRSMRVLQPRSIPADNLFLSEELLNDDEFQVQRGQPRPLLDSVGWVIGIPSKILLWNHRVDNHNISPRTEEVITEYLAVNGLRTTRVRLNQYAPRDDWRRLVRNKRVAAPWRYTLGTVATLGETIFPGRLIGGDHYNPFTDTIHLYSDVPAIAVHEAAHAKDFARRYYKGTYAAAYLLPVVPLYHESIASADALAHAHALMPNHELHETYTILYPAYGTYVGSALGSLIPAGATPLYYGAVVGGHVWGRIISHQMASSE
jgi:hypothetical protein